MAGIVDGQDVDAAASNAAWIAKNGDDTVVGKITLAEASTATITDIQSLANITKDAVGTDEVGADGTTYGATANTIDDGDNHEAALTKLANKFDKTTGHNHSGGDGEGPAIVDSRMPTQGENDALLGTSGSPSSSNKYVTDEGLQAQFGIEQVNPVPQAIAQGIGATDITGFTWRSDTVQTIIGHYTITRRVAASEGRRAIVQFIAYFNQEDLAWEVTFPQLAGTAAKAGCAFTFTDVLESTFRRVQLKVATDTVAGGGAYTGFITGKTIHTFVTE